jgi:hypothetical protein
VFLDPIHRVPDPCARCASIRVSAPGAIGKMLSQNLKGRSFADVERRSAAVNDGSQ